MTPFRFLVLLGICMAWGLHFSVIKSTITGVPPIFYAFMRMTVVAVLLIPFLRWHKGQMRPVLFAGLCFGALNYAFFFSGLKLVPASVGAILIEFYVPIAMLFSIIFLNEHVGWRRFFGAGLAVIGVMIIVGGGDEGLSPEDNLLIGGLLIIGGATAEAAGAILVKKIDGVKPLQLLAWFAVAGTLMTAFLTIIFERGQLDFLRADNTHLVFLAVGYSALIASIFGHTSYYWLLQRVDVSQVAPAGLMTTVFGILGGVFLLNETFTFQLVLGSVITMTGVAIIVVRSAQKASASETEPLPVAGPVGVRIQESNSVLHEASDVSEVIAEEADEMHAPTADDRKTPQDDS